MGKLSSEIFDGAERVRCTSYSSNGDGDVTRRMFWTYKDGTEETISESVIAESVLDKKIQDFVVDGDKILKAKNKKE